MTLKWLKMAMGAHRVAIPAPAIRLGLGWPPGGRRRWERQAEPMKKGHGVVLVLSQYETISEHFRAFGALTQPHATPSMSPHVSKMLPKFTLSPSSVFLTKML